MDDSTSGVRYWITIHWPDRADNPPTHGEGIFIADGRQAAGSRFRPGDRVLVYETASGRPHYELDPDTGKVRVVRRGNGRQGVIAIAEATSDLEYHDDVEAEEYTDGSRLRWCWQARTEVTNGDGFVPVAEVNRVLGLAPKYRMRNFGQLGSGLREIDREQFLELMRLFKRRRQCRVPGLLGMAKRRSAAGRGRGGSGKESRAHRLLKEYVAHDPADVLGEPGLVTRKVEHSFPTGDRADIFLVDEVERPVGVEIEVEQSDRQLDGLLQAVKYRYMLAIMENVPFEESRAMLIAYSLDHRIRRTCEKYAVEWHVIDREAVDEWSARSRE